MVRRLLSVGVVAMTAAAGFVVVGSVPAGAAPTGYTVQVNYPLGGNGIGPVSCRLAAVDLATGALTGIGAFQGPETLACATDLAFSPSGGLYGISEAYGDNNGEGPPVEGDGASAQIDLPLRAVHLVRFDTATGAVTDLGVIGTAGGTLSGRRAGGITFDAAGNLWVYMIGFDDPGCDGDAFCLYQVDPANPANAVFKGGDPQETYLFGLTASCTAGVFTLEESEGDGGNGASANEDVDVDPTGNFLDKVDPAIGKATKVGPSFGPSRFVQSLDFGADGVLYGIGTVLPQGMTTTGFVFTLDPVTGAATAGARLSAAQPYTTAYGLAVAAPSCPAPPPPPVIQPTFTG